jgi:hypothetical protein
MDNSSLMDVGDSYAVDVRVPLAKLCFASAIVIGNTRRTSEDPSELRRQLTVGMGRGTTRKGAHWQGKALPVAPSGDFAVPEPVVSPFPRSPRDPDRSGDPTRGIVS